MANIDEAPDTARLARRKSLHKTGAIQSPAHAVDPTHAKRLVHRPGISQTTETAVFPAEANQYFFFAGVVLVQPAAELDGVFKKCGTHLGKHLGTRM